MCGNLPDDEKAEIEPKHLVRCPAEICLSFETESQNEARCSFLSILRVDYRLDGTNRGEDVARLACRRVE